MGIPATTGINEGGLYSGSPIRAALNTSPFLPMYDNAGNFLSNKSKNNVTGENVYYNGTKWVSWEAGKANPYATMNMTESHSTNQKNLAIFMPKLNL
ncbi:MAG: hypothetical protein QM800_00645 [Paludibacter sp.]